VCPLCFYKIQSNQENVIKAPAIASNRRKTIAIKDAQLMLENLNITPKLRIKIEDALDDVLNTPNKAVWAIANGSAEDLTKVKNKVKRISQRLVDKSIVFADVVPNKGEVNIFSKSKSASNGKRLLKSIAIVGSVVSVVDAKARLEAANHEDQLFAQAMQDLGINDPIFANNSLNREIIVIGAEEAGGAGGFLAGASAAAVPSAACNAAYLVCVGIAGVIGSFVGDSGGGAAAGFTFDQANKPSQEQVEEMRRKIRELRREADFKVISEDKDKAGGQ